jgi:photosystem II stability/assembly factor-like uncharacterized protein
VQSNLDRSNVRSRVLLAFLLVGIAVSFFSPGILQAKQGLYDDLFSVDFATDKDGWACGRWGAVLHTADGGASWARQNSGTDNTLSCICFVDAQNGWAVGDLGTIVHTGDGGKTWETQKSPVPFFLMGVHFATPLKGWVVTEQTHILYTADGGKTWTVQFKDEDYILKAVSFADELHGWAVGEYGYIYGTQDGGTSWQKLAGFFRISEATGNPEGGSFMFSVKALDANRVWAAGIDGVVIKTEDGGKTWKDVVTGAPKTQLFGLASDGAGKFVIGGYGAFIVSNDDGRTWETPAFEPPLTYGWTYGVNNRGSSGFVTVGGEGVIYLSTSGTWKKVDY